MTNNKEGELFMNRLTILLMVIFMAFVVYVEPIFSQFGPPTVAIYNA